MEPHITGAWRQPRNTSAHQKGGIHDDDTATDLGFRGGTVAGAIHMEQFPPLLAEAFGEAWWTSGSLSTYFRSATIDLESVRCFVGKPQQNGSVSQAPVWMEKEDGTLVLDGTASVGADSGSALARKLAEIQPISDIRILASMQVGDRCEPLSVNVGGEFVDAQLRVITEPLACYSAEARERVLPITQVVRAIQPAEAVLVKNVPQPYVGLYGAIEVQYHNGPVLADTDYLVTGRVVGLSDSPKTEILWWAFDITQGDTTVASVLKMDRIMKASSPLWAAE